MKEKYSSEKEENIWNSSEMQLSNGKYYDGYVYYFVTVYHVSRIFRLKTNKQERLKKE